MKQAVALGLAGVLGLAAVMLGSAPAQAQFYGAEDGYDDDEFGWGPAYRRDTTFRPAIGFYGGVERPYPYGAPETTNPVVRNGIVYGGPGIVRRGIAAPATPYVYGAPAAGYRPGRAVRSRSAMRSRKVVRGRAAARAPARSLRVVIENPRVAGGAVTRR